MGSLSGLGVGLSFLFGCLLMGLMAELYYLLWWKRRLSSSSNREKIEEFSLLFCWKKPSPFSSTNSSQELRTAAVNPHEIVDGESRDIELGVKGYGEEGLETEIMRMHNLHGPPRFLFSITEENKEDLESEDGKSRGDLSSRKGSRTRSLSDLFAETPFLTPLSSPMTKSPNSLDSYGYSNGFNPLFESLSEAELNRLRSSPPPRFKFLKDAEDKLIKKLMEEKERKKNEEERR